MSVPTRKIVIPQGSDFGDEINLKDANGDALDLSGTTAKAKIKTSYRDSADTLLSLDTIDGSPIIGSPSESGIKVEPGGVKGRLKIVVTEDDTASLTVTNEQVTYAVWELELVDHPEIGTRRVLEGVVEIRKQLIV